MKLYILALDQAIKLKISSYVGEVYSFEHGKMVGFKLGSYIIVACVNKFINIVMIC